MKWNGLNSLMKKRTRTGVYPLLVFSIILLVFLGCSNPVGEQGEPLDTFTGKLDKRITSVMDTYNIPGTSIALIKDRNLVWSNAYGYADIKQNKKMSTNAIYRAESISKSVTTWGVMKLVERGLISLDDPVRQYLNNWSLPESEYNLNDVTIRRLLSNSAGIPLGTLGEEYSPSSEKPSLKQYLSKEVLITYEPGSNFEYSNPGFNLLELLVEEVTSRDFNDYMMDEVLLPLGMHNSSFDWDEDWSSRVPVGYDLQGNSVPPYVYSCKASGGLFSTVEDIARFAIAEIAPGNNGQPNVLNGESIQTMQKTQINVSGFFGFVADSYGFGHFIETLPEGKKAVWHGGQGHGWMTHFHIIPETGDGIVILTNSQRSWPLIAHVLNDWSRWAGYGTVKFSRITSLVGVLWVITGIIFLVGLYLGGTIVHGVLTGRRRWSITPYPYSKNRIIEFIFWAALSSVLLWSVSQEYLFISSIFPVGASWLGWGILLLSFVLLYSIIFPRYQPTNYSTSTFDPS